MSTKKYQLVTNSQMIVFGIFVAIIASCIVIAVQFGQDYMSLPQVIKNGDDCASVINYKNGDAFTCPDVDVILRKYRIKTSSK